MEAELHYRALERLYHSAKIQDTISNSTIMVSHSHTEISWQVDAAYFHGANAMHGSLYFKLLDDAAYFAVASIVKDVFIVTSSFQINLVRPVTGGTIKAVGTLRSQGKNLYVAESTLYNDKGREVAFGTGQFMRTNQLLSSLTGYN